MTEGLINKMDAFLKNADKVLASTIASMNGELAAIESQREELNATLDGREARIHKVLAELGAAPIMATATRSKPAASIAVKSTTAAPKAKKVKASGAGEMAIAYLKAHAGQFVASETLAAEIGTTRVGDAIKSTADAELVENRGPGRKKEYRIKK